MFRKLIRRPKPLKEVFPQWSLARLLLEFFSAGFLGATMLGWSPSSSHKPGTQQPSTMTYDLTATRMLVVDFGAARK
ncbi:hypothetical protein NOF04DRAFT_2774 [Fusarium oxysporum II5]|uniref:Uncharacterized protein n=2 Tax=Fusarium oxysporum species complex TaxID=171631 RepID=X0JJE8_FUSO5|nr:uncharacterized protein FOIG_07023 [Fusarium odoratissimum NRRL 54006]EXM01394.1 hypothetical protein FOIG_07023 [Fusarium odoratissimum NRRL 54006]KAK2129849.1 hypothetical protein NOF04DRAFT_2774 [Fusarium oxysporum II5]TXC01493.1 hypothetical protein FocTR4_00008749 [Fusarium oxysporum f. sp. cubense]